MRVLGFRAVRVRGIEIFGIFEQRQEEVIMKLSHALAVSLLAEAVNALPHCTFPFLSLTHYHPPPLSTTHLSLLTHPPL